MADRNVLIYEPYDKFLKALMLYFRGSSYDPISATTSAALFASAAQKKPHLLLVAVEQVDDDSTELLRRIGSDGATSGIPILVMSTGKDERELFPGGAASAGAAAFIRKPFTKKAILQILDEVSAGGRPAAGGKGMDLGTVFSEIESQVDSFFEASSPGVEEQEFSITLEEDAASAGTPSDEPLALHMDDDPAPVPAPARVAPAFGSHTPAPPPPSATTAPQSLVAEADAGERRDHDRRDDDVQDSGELRRLRERIRELEGELQQKSEEFKAVAREKERIEHAVGKKESDFIDRIKGLEKQGEELEDDLKKRKQLAAQMTASVQQLTEDLEQKDSKHDRDTEELRAQIAKAQAQFEEMQERSSGQAHDIEDKAEEIARHKRRIADLEGERNELQSNLERMTEAKAEADRVNAGLDADLATERGRIGDARQKLDARVTELRQGLAREVAEARAALERDLAAEMAEARSALERGLEQAKAAAGRGLDQVKEASDRADRAAEQAVAEATSALLGK